jgi:hypothetical protein
MERELRRLNEEIRRLREEEEERERVVRRLLMYQIAGAGCTIS